MQKIKQYILLAIEYEIVCAQRIYRNDDEIEKCMECEIVNSTELTNTYIWEHMKENVEKYLFDLLVTQNLRMATSGDERHNRWNMQ